MASFFSYLTKHPFPSKKAISAVFARKKSFYGTVACGAFLATLICFYLLLLAINNYFLISIPASGGTLRQGIIGSPQLTASFIGGTHADNAITSLTTAGLYKKESQTTVLPELALSFSIEETAAHITLSPKAFFSNGTKITTHDVVYSFKQIQEHTNDQLLQQFTLTPVDESTLRVYATDTALLKEFPLHATFPVVQAESTTQLSVSSGPFYIKNTEYSNGIPTTLTLHKNTHYVTKKPFLDTILLRFYPNQTELLQALRKKDIDVTYDIATQTLSPEITNTIPSYYKIISVPSQKHFALYRQRGDHISASPALRTLFTQFIDKKNIIAIVENGYGTVDTTTDHTLSTEQARALVSQTKTTPLSIAVENDATMVAIARTIAMQFSHIGIEISVNVFDPGMFQEKVRQQEYSVILAATPETTIPNGYELLVPLYTQAIPFIVTSAGITTVPELLPDKTLYYSKAPYWYSVTDRIWKFMKHK